MSEYQYYEFQALDRRLTEPEQQYIHTLSSRVQLTPTQAIFVYNYADFRGDPQKVLEKCFDAMLYMANWGSRQLMFRFPKDAVDVPALKKYVYDSGEDVVALSTTGAHVILNISTTNDDLADWIDSGEGNLSRLVALREDIMRGDYRALYLAWLNAARWAIEFSEEEDELYEPPVPPNLKNLSAPLRHFVEFFALDEDLIDTGAEASLSGQQAAADLEGKIGDLPESVRNDLLCQVLRGEARVDLELKRRLRELLPAAPALPQPGAPARTITQIVEAAEALACRREEEEKRKTEAARVRRLKALIPQEPGLWQQVYALIAQKKTAAYEDAIKILVQLRDLAEFQGQQAQFQAKISQIHQDYKTLSGLRSRMRSARLNE